MNTALAALIVVGAAGLAIAALLVVRRRAPDGGYFSNGDRAAGVFGVLATGFSVLLGFIIFLAFESYDQSRTGAETEALTVAQLVENAHLMPGDSAPALVGDLMCYARYVVNQEWPQMESGGSDRYLNPWGASLFSAVERLDPETPAEEAGFGKWLDLTSTREEARRDRLHGAAGVIPTPLWIVLFLTSAIIFVFMLFFADSGELAVVQGLLIGSVVSVLTAMLLLLSYLDDPFHDGIGGLEPTAMRQAIAVIEEQLDVTGTQPILACDAAGLPLATP